MLETGIPNVLWRTKKYNDKLYGEIQSDEKKFLQDVDTNYNPSLNERQPSDKKFTFKKEVNDFGLSDAISNMKFNFKSADSNFLLNDQLISENKFKRSGGLGGINSQFDSMAPKSDYRYVDPQYYEYRLNGMTIEKLVENKRGQPEQDYLIVPDQLDPTSRAIQLRNPKREGYDTAASKIQSRFKGYAQRENERGAFPTDEAAKKLLHLAADNNEGITETGRGRLQDLKQDFEKKIEIQKAKRKDVKERETNIRNFAKKVQKRREEKLMADTFKSFKKADLKSKRGKALGLNLEGIHQEPSQPSHSYATRGNKAQYEEQSKEQAQVEAIKKIQKVARTRTAKKEAKVELEQAKVAQAENLKSASDEKRAKILASIEQRNKEAEEFKKGQEEAEKLRNNTEKQINTYKRLISDLDKIPVEEKVPRGYFKELRPLFIMHKKSLGTQYKVGTMRTILEQWKEDIESKENEINEHKQKQSEAKKKEDKIYEAKSGGGVQKSSNIKTFNDIAEEIGEEKWAKPRSQRGVVQPGKGATPQFSGRSSYRIPAETTRESVFGKTTGR